jgi:hypothetical protein
MRSRARRSLDTIARPIAAWFERPIAPYRSPELVDAAAERTRLVHRATHATGTNPTRTVLVEGRPATECIECGERTPMTSPK